MRYHCRSCLDLIPWPSQSLSQSHIAPNLHHICAFNLSTCRVWRQPCFLHTCLYQQRQPVKCTRYRAVDNLGHHSLHGITFIEDDIHHNAGEADMLLNVTSHFHFELPPASMVQYYTSLSTSCTPQQHLCCLICWQRAKSIHPWDSCLSEEVNRRVMRSNLHLRTF